MSGGSKTHGIQSSGGPLFVTTNNLDPRAVKMDTGRAAMIRMESDPNRAEVPINEDLSGMANNHAIMTNNETVKFDPWYLFLVPCPYPRVLTVWEGSKVVRNGGCCMTSIVWQWHWLDFPRST